MNNFLQVHNVVFYSMFEWEDVVYTINLPVMVIEEKFKETSSFRAFTFSLLENAHVQENTFERAVAELGALVISDFEMYGTKKDDELTKDAQQLRDFLWKFVEIEYA